jgi:phage tail tape-measure protein
MGQLNLKVLISAVDRLTGPVRKISRVLRVELAGAARIGGNALRSMTGWAAKAATALLAMSGFSFGATIGGVIRTGAAFESYGAALETAEGSAARARQAMSWIEQFAKDTPYELDQVTEAYIALRNYGIDPTSGSFRSVGNASSAMQKSVMQGVEALADAQTGEFERLKEFGIRARAESNSVTFTYMRDGKEMVVTSRKNAAAIQAAVLGIFDARFEGAMERQSKTMNGLWSNLMDWVSSFQQDIADAGVFDFIKGELQALLDQINIAAANGDLSKWAKEISDKLVELLTSLKMLITQVDWVELTKAVIDTANAFAKFIDWIGGIDGLITSGVGAAIGWLTSAFMSLGVAIATALGIAVAPVAIVIAAIGLIALAAWFIYRNWEEIWELLKAGWKGFVDWLGGLGKWLSDAFKVAIAMVWATFPAWFRAAISGGGMIIKAVTHAVGGGGSGGGGNRATAPQPNVPGRAVNSGLAVTVTTRNEGPPRVSAVATGPAVRSLVTENRRGGGVD